MNRNSVFESLVRYFEKKNIQYCLLGISDDYANKPGDIDIVISPSTFENLDKIIGGFCSNENLIASQKLLHEITACYYVISFFNAEENAYNYIELDFCSDYRRYGRLYIKAEQLLMNTEFVKPKGYWQLNDTYSFIYYLIKKLEKNSLNQDQFEQLTTCWRSSRNEIIDKLQYYFSRQSSTLIAGSFDLEDLSIITKSFNKLRTDLLHRNPKHLRDIIIDKIRLVKRVINPTGLMICILGRDGSGKTTFSNELIFSIHPCFRNTARFHLYPKLLFRDRDSLNDYSSPHAQKPRNTFMSFLKLNLFFIEYFFGFWLKIYPKKIKSNLILFDRYFIDILVDPIRYKNKKNQYLIKIFHHLIPKPDIWIILDVSSEILLSRKKELTYEMSEKLRTKYLGIKDYLPNSILIDTGKGVQECVNEASTFILEKMKKKYNI